MDVDKTARTVTIRNPAKNGMPRQIRVSEKYINILDRQSQNGARARKNFHRSQGHTATKTANSDLRLIRPHTFRHFSATKLYLQTRDIRHVQKKMGHRSITSTTICENSELTQDVETYSVKGVVMRE